VKNWKVVSTNISLEDFIFLEKYARICYNKNLLKQPTISLMLRLIIKRWVVNSRKEEFDPSSPFYEPSIVPDSNLPNSS
jgi:hypothetical protein